MNRVIALLACSLISALNLSAAAEEMSWPTKPIHLIVPGGVGGVTDIRARWLADHLTPVLGQSIIVENKPGAGAMARRRAPAVPRTDTHCSSHQGTMTVNPHVYSHLGRPDCRLRPNHSSGVVFLLAVNPDIPVTTVAELGGWQKRNQAS